MKIETKRAASVGKIAVAFAVIVLVAGTGWAQRGGGATVRVVPVGRVVAHAGGGRPMPRAAGRIATPLNPNFAPLNSVPGNGFDYQHLVAVGASTRTRRGASNRSVRSFITPIFGYGLPYYYASDSGYPYDNGVPSEQMSAAPLVPTTSDGGEAPYDEAEAPAIAAPALSPVPPPELGQLILVRRDGQVIMAVAFTTSSGRLTYITQDGLRRSFPVAELDADATRQMNSVNGTSVALPN